MDQQYQKVQILTKIIEMIKGMSKMSRDVIFSGKKPLRDSPQHLQGLVIKPKPSNHVKILIYYH